MSDAIMPETMDSFDAVCCRVLEDGRPFFPKVDGSASYGQAQPNAVCEILIRDETI